ncbi:MAG: Asp-tRNA(Asn)/Glu-tRNA(Gln) amidotransferase subunit GatC [Geodermatophilaceae bacterium]
MTIVRPDSSAFATSYGLEFGEPDWLPDVVARYRLNSWRHSRAQPRGSVGWRRCTSAAGAATRRRLRAVAQPPELLETPYMASISREEVAHLARLARLAVTDDELDVFAGQLDVILGAVARVGEVAADDIPPTSHAVPVVNVLRPDELRPSLPREEVLAAAPAAEDGRFRVPRILDDPGQQ